LKGASLERVKLDGAFLPLAQLQGALLEGAELQEATLEGANLQRASLAGASLRGVSLRWAELQGASFRNAALQGALLDEAQLQGALLDEAHLEGASLEGAQLQGAKLIGAHLEGASLGRAEHHGRGITVRLWGTRNDPEEYVPRDGANLQGAWLARAHLQGASVEGVRLQGAWLDDANLAGASLKGAHLQGAKFDGARLQGTNFRDAAFAGTSLAKAQIWRSTVEVKKSDAVFGDDLKEDALSIEEYSLLESTIIKEVPEGERSKKALERIGILNPDIFGPEMRVDTAIKREVVDRSTYQKASHRELESLICAGDKNAGYIGEAVSLSSFGGRLAQIYGVGSSPPALDGDLLSRDCAREKRVFIRSLGSNGNQCAE